MVRRASVGLALLCCVAVAVSLVPLGTVAQSDAGIDSTQITTPEGFNNTVFRIRAFGNGSARWTIQYSRPLNETEVDQFETFAEEFETTETETYADFQVRAEQLAASGSEATGREMNATAFRRSADVATLGQTRGVVSMSFLWTNFSRPTPTGRTIDDVFDGGLYIGESQRLVVARGPTVAFSTVEPPPDSPSDTGSLTATESVTWFGPEQFADDRPLVVLTDQPPQSATPASPDLAAPSETTEADREETGTERPRDSTGALGPLGMMLVFVVLVVGIGGLAWYSGTLGRSTDDAVGASASSPEPTGTDSSSEGTTAATPAELLSDEDRVVQLLEANGGRMKQVDIVDETGWSKSKVSMLLSEMEEDGQISKLRVGRENIISLTGEEPDAAGSPFDEE